MVKLLTCAELRALIWPLLIKDTAPLPMEATWAVLSAATSAVDMACTWLSLKAKTAAEARGLVWDEADPMARPGAI